MTRTLLMVCGLLLFAVDAPAQGVLGPRAAIRAQRRAEQQQQRRNAQQDAPQQARRQQLQQQVRRTLWRVAKQRIGFTDDQMLRLERTSQRFDRERRQLAMEEKAERVAMRHEILADSAANQTVIATALDHLHAVQQRRLDIQAEEQKEFANFMTPLQRARFAALQEQVRKRLMEFERARSPASADALPATP